MMEFYWWILFLSIGGISYARVEDMEDQRGAFVQTGEELHFFVDPPQYWSESVSSRLLPEERPQSADHKRRPPSPNGGNSKPSSSGGGIASSSDGPAAVYLHFANSDGSGSASKAPSAPSPGGRGSGENASNRGVKEEPGVGGGGPSTAAVDPGGGGGGEADASGGLNQLQFEPSYLEFGFQAIGVPEQKKVKVTNPTASKVRFDAISGSTVHFHCSFFNEKTIEPGSSTTFDVVFLPRAEGQLRNTLSIHSSLGAFQYVVSGVGTSNPYRLRPFVGARVPLNGTFIGPLEMHNPHPHTLRVVEMYTSGGDLHVDLPVDGRGEGVPQRSVWEIPPFQTRTVGKARYIGARVRNATAYIRIKTEQAYNYGSDPISGHTTSTYGNHQEALIVPIEIEVTAKPGLYANVDRLDFGTLVEGEQSKWVLLHIYNTHNRTVEIVTVEPDSESIRVDFRQSISLTSNTRDAVYVAKFSYDAAKSEPSTIGRRLRSGRISVKSKDGRYALSVPYSVQVLEGRLIHDPGEVAFYYGQQQKIYERNVTLWNVFDTPVALYNITLPKTVRKMFKIQDFASPVVIPPKSSQIVFTLVFNRTAAAATSSNTAHKELLVSSSSPLESRLRLHTNISRFDVPLHLFDGNLRFTLYSIDQREFDFGVMDVAQERYVVFAITNENPIAITIKNMTAALATHTVLELLGVEEGNHSVLSYDHSPADYKWRPGEDFTVPARSFAVFRYGVIAPYQRAVYHARMIFRTAFQLIEFPVTFSVEEGSIVSVPEKIIIDDAFPGKISSHALQVFSTFPRDMPLLRLSTLSNDPRFFFESLEKENQSPVIKQGEITRLGRIFFMPLATCLDDCYVGLPLETDDGHHWIRGMRLPADLPEIDVYLYRKLRSKWDAIVERAEHIANSTIMVDSTEVKNLAVKTEGRLVWPRLMKQSAVHFPLTAVGNYTIVNVTLQNPSNLPVAVQLLPLTIYPGPYDLMKMLENDLASPLTSYVEVDDVLIFSLRDSELYNARPESPVPHLRQELERIVGIQIPRFTLSMLLQPGMKVRVRIGFLPPDYQLRSTLLLIRNNLTALETVTLYGRGGKLEMRIQGKLPNSKHPLLFEIKESHLPECKNWKRIQHKFPTPLTVRKSFLTKNTGELPLLITNMSVSGHHCQGRGFRILNCEPFRLQPNETQVLDIAFTSDFTMSWVEAYLQLYIAGTLSPLNYPIGVSLPREWLPRCQAALPRPYWEPLMYYSSVTALGFLLICTIASAYLEGDRIITCAQNQHVNNYRRQLHELNGQAARPFSLRHPNGTGYENGGSIISDSSSSSHLTNGHHHSPSSIADLSDTESTLTTQSTIAPSGGERTRSLPYRLIMLFYYLITKRFWAAKQPITPNTNQPPTANQHRSRVGAAPNRSSTNHSKPTPIDPKHNRASPIDQDKTTMNRRSANGQPQEATRKSSEDSATAGGGGGFLSGLLKRPSAVQTPPAVSQPTPPKEQVDRKNSGGKSAKKKIPEKAAQVQQPKSGSTSGKEDAQTIKPSKSPRPPVSPLPSAPLDPAPRQIRSTTTSDKETRKSDAEQNRRHSSQQAQQSESPSEQQIVVVSKRSSRGRSSREVSESEPDETRSLTKQQQQLAKLAMANRSRPIISRQLIAEDSSSIATMAKPDNRETAEKLKLQQRQQQEQEQKKSKKQQVQEASNRAQFLRPPGGGASGGGGGSESEESAAPEWDRASMASGGGDFGNVDDAFDQLASETQTFAARNNSEPAKLSSKSRHHHHQRLLIATESAPLNLKHAPSPASPHNLPSPIGNASVLSSTSRSDSISSLDASESSSPSPDEQQLLATRNGKKPKKPSATVGLGSSPRSHPHHQRVQKSVSAQMPPAASTAKKPPMAVGPPRQNAGASGAIGEGRRQLQQQNQPIQSPTDVGSSSSKSIMQQLREERMRRLQEHYVRKLQTGGGSDAWPGFDTPPTGGNLGESLWDEEHDPWRGGPRPGNVGEERRQQQPDIWGATWGTLGGAGGATGGSALERPPSNTDNPFPSFFDFRVNTSADWSYSPSSQSPLNVSDDAQSQHQQQQQRLTVTPSPPSPLGASAVMQGPPGMENVPRRSPFAIAADMGEFFGQGGAQARPASAVMQQQPSPNWTGGSIMTGFDIPWTQSLLTTTDETPSENQQQKSKK